MRYSVMVWNSNGMRYRVWVWTLLLAAVLFPRLAVAQMVDPEIDRKGESFCYFSQPTDVIGVMDGREGTLVSPEGYLFTGWGEMIFFAGNPPQPLQQRVKTLYKGYLPILEYTCRNSGIDYHFTLFAATLDGRPESPLINFIRVRISNSLSEKRTAFFSTAIRYQNEANTDWGVGDNRFGRPATAEQWGGYEQAGAEFSQQWEYAFADDAVLRDSCVLYLFPAAPEHERLMTLKMGYNEAPALAPNRLYILPTTPAGIVRYRLPLEAGESVSLDFKMPYEPQPLQRAVVAQMRAASFDDYFNRTVAFWEALLARGLEISLPESKVTDTFKANLIYALIARDKVDSFYIQKVNEFQYDQFWLRDAAYFVRMYDLSGYHEIARQCLDFFPRWQREDGNFVSQGGQYDGWGQTLWAYGQHYQLTGGRAFAEKVWPAVVRAVDWLHNIRQTEPWHLLPVTTPGDNEQITGHVTGHNFWALIGLRQAAGMAEGLGKKAEAQRFRREYDDLFRALNRRLAVMTARSGGYIPPGLDSLGGNDWGNMMGLTPEVLLKPFDPRVTATLQATRAKYQEGLMTYDAGRYLHHYLTLQNTESELVRGEQETALHEFYAVLMHTSATHAGFEYSIRPWADRDFGMNLSPHGWFGAMYRTLLRDMLVREEGQELHLLSLVSPVWTRPGDSLAVRRAPTLFGEVNFTCTFTETGVRMRLDNRFRQQPARMIIHLPWFASIEWIEADGRRVRPYAGAVQVPAGSRAVLIQWSKTTPGPEISYQQAVDAYKQEYRQRYEHFLREGR